jgi:hypothetical protein
MSPLHWKPWAGLLFLAGLSLSAAGPFPVPPELPVRQAWPDPLQFLDGSPVTSAMEWNTRRRPELRELFQHYMYGTIPDRPSTVKFETQAVFKDFLGGKGTLKVVSVSFGDAAAPKIDLMVIVPNQAKGRVPVFLGINFCGNHALSEDSRIPLARGWLYDSCKGCRDGHATDAARGGQAQDWPIGEILDRGYALASFCTSDIDPDRKEFTEGLYAWLASKAGSTNPPKPADRGTLAAWAWGCHRCVDYLVTDPDLDPKRIALVGHSRNGKTALLAAAFDDRIALAIPHQAGCGGTAPSRGTVGESVQRINTAFPHWFNGNFKAFNTETARLPFDQHCLVALMAPRPVLLSNAVEDQWANPSGQFQVLQAAEPVYRLLKAGTVAASVEPGPGQLVASRLGYYIRPGKHSMTAGDWRVFMEFADAHFGRAR